ncbi:MAG: DNA mismatch repair protein MutT, partial [Candidatus Symbiothrix sp.]|nr:DNA mismatch repair protein MutT [Candidatus Symbiothrix sp.]
NIYLYSGLEVHTVDLFYKCETNNLTTLRAGDDAAELYFLDRNDIQPGKFGLTSIRRAVEIYLNKKEN